MMRRTYDVIARAIRRLLLQPKWAKAIVRRSGIRPGGGVGEDFTYYYRLPPGGRPGDGIYKLHEPPDTDHDDFLARHAVGWRGPGHPRLHQGLVNLSSSSGPPCSARIYSAQNLRESALRSGIDNQNRFGYAHDMWRSDSSGSGGVTTSWWWRRAKTPDDGGYWSSIPSSYFPTNSWWRLSPWESEGGLGLGKVIMGGPERSAYSGFCRIVAYITRADHDYQLRLLWTIKGGANSASSIPELVIPMGRFTGRYISDWIPATVYFDADPSSGTNYQPRTFDAPRWSTEAGTFTNVLVHSAQSQETRVRVEHGAARPNDPTYTRPVGTPAQLSSGEGPLCIPFIEVEQKTIYHPPGVWEIQNADTIEEWRKTEMQRLIDAGQWPYPTSWPV